MKITKYPQSCFLIETENKKILIDPGEINFDNSFLKDWEGIDIVLVTHKHRDHCYPDAIKIAAKSSRTKFYTTQEVSLAYPELPSRTVKAGDVLKIDTLTIEVVKAVHGYLPFLKDGKEINENVGYIIDDGTTRIYHTSDTICFKNEHKCDVLLAPISNHGLVMGPYEAILFAQETGVRLVIPMHYDNPKFSVNIQQVKKEFSEQEINFRFMKVKESLEM